MITSFENRPKYRVTERVFGKRDLFVRHAWFGKERVTRGRA